MNKRKMPQKSDEKRAIWGAHGENRGKSSTRDDEKTKEKKVKQRNRIWGEKTRLLTVQRKQS